MDPQRRAQLLAVKLTALAGVAADDAAGSSGEFGAGAALLHDGVAWVLLDDQPERGLGAALAWALRRDATSLVLLAERGTGTLARRAAGFRFPIDVRHVDGRTLLPAVAEPLPVPSGVPAEHLEWEATIREGGAQPVVEHGVLAGEARGLEVCRVVDDPDTGAVRLDVGVGAHDRETFQLLHGDKPKLAALTDVVQAVAQHRVPDAPRHPLNLLAQERAMRARLVEHPDLIGADQVVPAQPPVPRANLKDAVPCVAEATIGGRTVAVVCSVGVDLDVVPFAVDACSVLGVAECLVVVPARDALDIQRRIAAQAVASVQILPFG